jgi:hypothetical protein
MKGLIIRNISVKGVLLLFVLTSVVYTLMLTITIPKVMSFSEGMKILDMIPTGYNVDYVNSLLNTLGVKGRDAYLFNQIPLDMIYPFLFGITYCLILAYILKKLDKLESYLFNVCFLPLFSGLFDYFENIGIITILNTYPNNSNKLTEITNVFSILKSSFTTISFIMLITLLILIGIRKLYAKTNGINK